MVLRTREGRALKAGTLMMAGKGKEEKEGKKTPKLDGRRERRINSRGWCGVKRRGNLVLSLTTLITVIRME